MWKLIFKNLYSRRRRMAWLIAEMAIVTIVIWVFIDPIIVNGYVDSLPLGYDRDRLCLVKTRRVKENSPGYNAERTDSASSETDLRNLIRRVTNMPEVESATIVDWSYPDAMGYSSISVGKDSVWLSLQVLPMVSGMDYLTTFGIDAIDGSPVAGQLQNLRPETGNIIITRSVSNLLFPGSNAVGRYIGDDAEDFTPEDAYRITGVVEDVRPQSVSSCPLVAFRPYEFNPDLDYSIVVRLRSASGKRRFIHDFKERMSTEMRSGNYMCYDINSYDNISEEAAYSAGVTNDLRLRSMLLLFFFTNLLLGVAGVFYLQTRKRSEEAGIMRSFGATPRRIRLMLLGEGWVLATAGCLIGCLVYLQYAVKEGLARAHSNTGYELYDSSWVSDLSVHFIVVSLVVYLLMLTVTGIGISIPAWRISRVNPVDALRHD